MVKKWQNNGFSLIELLVALGIIAALTALAIPAIKAMQKSYDSTGAESMINAALATARTLAITNQKYVGIRFQKAGDPNNALNAKQYMIFIINDEDMGTLQDAFRVIKGYKPIKLPENMGVMDMKLGNSADIELDDQIDDDNLELNNTTAFSIIFSPSGKLVIHDVQIRNKDGKDYNDSPGSDDDVFNIKEKVYDEKAMFIQDDYAQYGLRKELSRNRFKIYDCEKFSKLNPNERHSTYLIDLKFVHVNPYTGEIIKK